MTTDRGYLAAVLPGLVAAALVLWQLESSESTACFRDSVELSITGSETVLEDCKSESFEAVRDYVAAQRSSAAAGNAVEDPDEVEGRSALAGLGSRIRQLVSMLGAVLAISVLTTAARWQAIETLPGGESLPSIIVLLWGSVFALVLGALYVPVHQRWAAKTARLISDEVKRQLPDDQSLRGTAGFRAPELRLTKELQAALGVGGALKSLQGSVAVLAPVIAAAISSLFS